MWMSEDVLRSPTSKPRMKQRPMAGEEKAHRGVERLSAKAPGAHENVRAGVGIHLLVRPRKEIRKTITDEEVAEWMKVRALDF